MQRSQSPGERGKLSPSPCWLGSRATLISLVISTWDGPQSNWSGDPASLESTNANCAEAAALPTAYPLCHLPISHPHPQAY
jgi:hypothetical protein